MAVKLFTSEPQFLDLTTREIESLISKLDNLKEIIEINNIQSIADDISTYGTTVDTCSAIKCILDSLTSVQTNRSINGSCINIINNIGYMKSGLDYILKALKIKDLYIEAKEESINNSSMNSTMLTYKYRILKYESYALEEWDKMTWYGESPTSSKTSTATAAAVKTATTLAAAKTTINVDTTANSTSSVSTSTTTNKSTTTATKNTSTTSKSTTSSSTTKTSTTTNASKTATTATTASKSTTNVASTTSSTVTTKTTKQSTTSTSTSTFQSIKYKRYYSGSWHNETISATAATQANIMYKTLKSEGLNNAQIAGIMGNAFIESTFNNYQVVTDTNGAKAYGCFQNNGAGRYSAFVKYCSKNGYSTTSTEAQTRYLVSIMKQDSTFMSIPNTEAGAREAADRVRSVYEISGYGKADRKESAAAIYNSI